ncbi:hypothetical protein Tco_0008604 [Tanacetum coccineum]
MLLSLSRTPPENIPRGCSTCVPLCDAEPPVISAGFQANISRSILDELLLDIFFLCSQSPGLVAGVLGPEFICELLHGYDPCYYYSVTVPPVTGNFNIPWAVDGIALILLTPGLPIIPLYGECDLTIMNVVLTEEFWEKRLPRLSTMRWDKVSFHTLASITMGPSVPSSSPKGGNEIILLVLVLRLLPSFATFSWVFSIILLQLIDQMRQLSTLDNSRIAFSVALPLIGVPWLLALPLLLKEGCVILPSLCFTVMDFDGDLDADLFCWRVICKNGASLGRLILWIPRRRSSTNTLAYFRAGATVSLADCAGNSDNSFRCLHGCCDVTDALNYRRLLNMLRASFGLSFFWMSLFSGCPTRMHLFKRGYEDDDDLLLYYQIPLKSLDIGLKPLVSDSDISNLLGFVNKHKMMYVYVKQVEKIESSSDEDGEGDSEKSDDLEVLDFDSLESDQEDVPENARSRVLRKLRRNSYVFDMKYFYV